MLNVMELIGFGAGGSGNLAPTVAFVAFTTDGTNATTYTFTAASIGTASANRMVVVHVWGNGNATGNVASVTIGGVTAALVNNSTTSSTTDPRHATAYLKVTSGTTADIVVTFSNSVARAGISVYTVETTQTAPYSSSEDRTTDTDPLTLTLNVPQNGHVIAAYGDNDTGGSVIWTNVVEDYDGTLEGGQPVTVSGGNQLYASGNSALVITADGADGGTATYISATIWLG